MPRPITVTGVTLYGNDPLRLRGAASFSDRRGYEFSGTVEDGFGFVTAPAFGTNRTRWFVSPARDAALRAWFREKDAETRNAS